MVNAAMNTQLVLDRFNVTHIVFSGIAGGVNPSLNIGDVVVAERWGNTWKYSPPAKKRRGNMRRPAG